MAVYFSKPSLALFEYLITMASMAALRVIILLLAPAPAPRSLGWPWHLLDVLVVVIYSAMKFASTQRMKKKENQFIIFCAKDTINRGEASHIRTPLCC